MARGEGENGRRVHNKENVFGAKTRKMICMISMSHRFCMISGFQPSR